MPSNLPLLEEAVHKLQQLVDEVVFVGGATLDLMITDPGAQTVTLPKGTQIRVISAPYFLGTKLEAFGGRGENDYFASRDLEDFVAVLEGRQTILAEIEAAPEDL
jgi:predicted nucleotidyltransferase